MTAGEQQQAMLLSTITGQQAAVHGLPANVERIEAQFGNGTAWQIGTTLNHKQRRSARQLSPRDNIVLSQAVH